MLKKFIYKSFDISFYAIIPLLIIGISLDYTSFVVALLALLVLLLTNDRHTVGVFLIMYGGAIGGIVRTTYPTIPVYGVLLVVIGFLLIWDLLLEFLKTHWSSLLWLGLLLLVFGIFYLMGPMDEFSKNKYSKMCIHASIMLAGYYVLDKSNKIDAEGLVRIMLLGAICMFAFAVAHYGFASEGLFNYNWFRDQLLNYLEHEDTVVNYQHIGMLALYGITIYLAQTRLTLIKTVFYLVCSTQLILVSGCRQAILGLFVVVFLRFAVFRLINNSANEKINRAKKINVFNNKSWNAIRNSIVWKVFSLVVGFVVAYYAFIHIIAALSADVDIIGQTLDEGDIDRKFLLYKAWEIFKEHPIVGVGVGGFHVHTGEVWPHNFFLELLCETGLIGSLFFLVMIILNMVHKRVGLFHVTNANLFYFLIISALLVRIMVSSDFSESIELFSAIFAISSAKMTKKQVQTLNET